VSGQVMMAISLLLMVGTIAFLVGIMVRSIRNETRHPGVQAWKDFSLSIVLSVLFLLSWIGQAISEWQVFTDEQQTHGEAARVGDFLAQFSQSTLENWQSEFLQLFSFVVLAALFIHKGSAESKDSDEKMHEALQRIENRLDRIAPGDI
jgi:uncharacterized protein DUF6766